MVHYVRDYKRYYDLLLGALEQISDEEFFRVLAPSTNSVAVVVNHMAGNFKSRFTEFLTSDGEKAWRDRDAEFDVSGLSRADIMGRWQEAWDIVVASVWGLSEEDMKRKVVIRGVSTGVEAALSRSLSHFSYHVGEVVFIARYFRGNNWRYLSIAPGESAEFNVWFQKRGK